nr:ribonuclease H-like domain-containing protein [Tanacetum cinerariifolium]
DIYAAVDSCETAQEIWLRVQQMMKGSDIRIQEKKSKLFNEWEKFTSNEGESIDAIISVVEPQVHAAIITTVPAKVVVAPSRRRKGVVIRDPEEESTTSSIISIETKSKDKGKEIIVEEPKPLKKKQQTEMDEEYA